MLFEIKQYKTLSYHFKITINIKELVPVCTKKCNNKEIEKVCVEKYRVS